MVEPVTIAAGIGAAGSLLGGKKARDAASDAADTMAQFWEQAQQQYLEQFNQALAALTEGEAEASDEILRGLGLSLEERTKFFDIAKDNLEWIVDFGKTFRDDVKTGIGMSQESMEQGQQFLDHYSDLIFDPDAIYDTEVYKSIKDRSLEEWENFYSGKGLLGGNAQEAMVERMSELGYDFLQNERNAALAGHTAALNQSQSAQNLAALALKPVGLGAGASSNIADYAFRTGDANARDIMNAYSNLANITSRFNPSTLMMDAANFMGGGTANLGNAVANAQLAGGLGQSNVLGNMGNALITGGLSGIFQNPFANPTGFTTSGAGSSNPFLSGISGSTVIDSALMNQSTF